MSIIICQHNILSSLWLTKMYDLLPCVADFRKSESRHTRTATYLADIRADIYCLSEVDSESYEIFRTHPGFAAYHSCFCSNSPEFWNEWHQNREKWMPNGTCVFLSVD